MTWFEDILSPFVCVQFTSGTTGNPKGVTLSHHNLVNNAFNIGHRVGYDAEVFLKSILIPTTIIVKKNTGASHLLLGAFLPLLWQRCRDPCLPPTWRLTYCPLPQVNMIWWCFSLSLCPRLTWYDFHCVFCVLEMYGVEMIQVWKVIISVSMEATV